MSFTLQIVIVTYNRNQLLYEAVERVIGQLSDQVRLLIIDNASDVPVTETLSPLLTTHSNAHLVRLVRNRFNIGGDANFLRGLEYSEGEWTWFLGDDDIPEAEGAARVLSDVDAADDRLVYINYYSPCPVHPPRTQTVALRGVEDFVRRMDDFGAIIFLSACVVRTEPAQKQLSNAYNWIYSFTPIIATVLTLLGRDKIALLSHKVVVRYRLNYKIINQWSVIKYIYRVPILAEIFENKGLRKALLRKINASFGTREFFKSALQYEREHTFNGHGAFMYNLAVTRYYKYNYFSLNHIIHRFFGILLFFPHTVMAVINLLWFMRTGKRYFVKSEVAEG